MDMTEFSAAKDWTAQGSNLKGKGAAHTEFRGLQADLNQFAQACGFEGVAVDGILGPKTLAAVQAVTKAVVGKNPLLTPSTFAPPTTVDAVGQYALRIREWLHTTASQTLKVSPYRLFDQGAGKDWNTKGEIAYGAGTTADEFVKLQTALNSLAPTVGFAKLETDGFIGEKTAAAVKATYDKVVAKNPIYAAAPFPAPESKEETARFAAFIRDWLEHVAPKALQGGATS